MLRSLFGGQSGSVPGVNAHELKQILEDGGAVTLVDVRSDFEYEHDGHIEGAQLLPLQDLMQQVDALPREQEIIFVCRSGNRSMVACQQVQRLGFSNIKNFSGGMISWQTAGYPIVR